MLKKVVSYEISDGRTFTDRNQAMREQQAVDIVKSMESGLAKFQDGSKIAQGVISAMIKNGWRPPAKKYGKSKQPKEPKLVGSANEIPTLGNRRAAAK